jgi:hypothetical protein
MVDVTIGSLQLQVANASGHEHRMHDIATHAARLVGKRLGERYQTSSGPARALHLDTLTAPALDLDLNTLSNGEAAERIANAWLDTQPLRFGV